MYSSLHSDISIYISYLEFQIKVFLAVHIDLSCPISQSYPLFNQAN